MASDAAGEREAGAIARQIARDVVDGGVATMAAAACAVRGDAGWRLVTGGDDATLFDLASLTKPMTAVAIARSGIARGTTLGALVPELSGTASAGAPLELLLAHRAGLLPHVVLYEPLVRGEPVDREAALVTSANARRPEATGAFPVSGFAPVYSDVGYVLAGVALARHDQVEDAGASIARRVVAPLGMEGELGTARELEARGVDLAMVAAPTEVVAWRGGVVRGRVHDENAWALTGRGSSGHAGMFGTARAVLAFGCAVLDALERVDARGVSELDWLVAPRPGGSLRAGFDGKSDAGSSAGATCGARTFGHLGFTGTSLWIDPEARAVVALLTNRVHPTRENVAIRAARPRAHDALFALAASVAERRTRP